MEIKVNEAVFELRRIKIAALWCLCIGLSVAAGALWWTVFGGDSKPREPAMRVSEVRPARPEIQALPPLRTHVVAAGDTLSSIAKSYGVDLDTLRGANEGVTERIYPGEKLTILPQNGVLYTVREGDSLWRIAKLYRVEVGRILAANKRGAADMIMPGEQLFLPGAKPIETRAASAPASRGGDDAFGEPARGVVSSPFGQRWGHMHEGVDIANDAGTPIRAALGGKVTHAGWIQGYGYTVILEHRQGYTTLYGHMQEILTQNGAAVARGQVIGRMGSTGNSTGPHVHFEVRRDGALLDPQRILGL